MDADCVARLKARGMEACYQLADESATLTVCVVFLWVFRVDEELNDRVLVELSQSLSYGSPWLGALWSHGAASSEDFRGLPRELLILAKKRTNRSFTHMTSLAGPRSRNNTSHPFGS